MKKIKLFNFKRGQATTEVVLLFPLFLILIIFLSRIFGLLVLVQKMEIAAFYAAKRWSLESHETPEYRYGWDVNFLQKDIEKKVREYLGFDNLAMRNFMGLRDMSVTFKQENQVWHEVTVNVRTNPTRLGLLCKYNKDKICTGNIRTDCLKGYAYICDTGETLQVKKFVPFRSRPIKFHIPV